MLICLPLSGHHNAVRSNESGFSQHFGPALLDREYSITQNGAANPESLVLLTRRPLSRTFSPQSGVALLQSYSQQWPSSHAGYGNAGTLSIRSRSSSLPGDWRRFRSNAIRIRVSTQRVRHF